MPLKDDVAKYYAQGKEAVSEYVEAYKDKEKQRKESKDLVKDDDEKKASKDDTQTAATATSTASPAAVLAGPGEAVTPIDSTTTTDVNSSSTMLQKYKDRLAIKLPTGQFDIGKFTRGAYMIEH
jgi:hypothetical protein